MRGWYSSSLTSIQMSGPKVTQQNVAQSITLTTGLIFPKVHPGEFYLRKCACTWLTTCWKKVNKTRPPFFISLCSCAHTSSALVGYRCQNGHSDWSALRVIVSSSIGFCQTVFIYCMHQSALGAYDFVASSQVVFPWTAFLLCFIHCIPGTHHKTLWRCYDKVV